MKYLLSLLCSAILVISSGGSVVNESKVKKNLASSILHISNTTSSTTITSVTIFWTQGYHTPSYFTINTSIAPTGTYDLDLGNSDEDITVLLQLSNSISGDIQVNEIGPYNCPWLACNIFSTTNAPNVTFHMYTGRWLYLSNSNICVC